MRHVSARRRGGGGLETGSGPLNYRGSAEETFANGCAWEDV